MKPFRPIAFLLLLTCLFKPGMAQDPMTGGPVYNARLTGINETTSEVIENAGIHLMWHDRLPEAQAMVTMAQADWLISKGMDVTILSPAPEIVDPEYHTFDELWSHLDSLLILYPGIMTLDTFGYSHQMHYPIPIVKISDNPATDEDEAVIYYDGMHHAREPVGMEICLKVIGHLLAGYSNDPQVQKWVDDTEIFIVPCMNPEGWRYVTDSLLNYPWWRKNLHDNNGNGMFDPSYDGVDLNRNYDFWWDYADSNPGSETYRGPSPFSESELTVKRDLLLAQKPVLAISYHSYGEVVLFPQCLGFDDIPEWPVMYMIASDIAGLIPSLSGPDYGVGSVDGTWSTSHNWGYQAAGTIEICIETADVFIPSGQTGQQVAADNLEGALYLLERAFTSGITGHAWNGENGEPLPATIEIVGVDTEMVEPRTCDSLYGRYHRLLLPGSYTVRAFAENTDTVTVSDVMVNEDTLTVLDFELMPPVGFGEPAVPGPEFMVNCHPNPSDGNVNCQLSIVDCRRVTIKLYDIHGREVATMMEGTLPAGEHTVQFDASGLPDGIYFYRLMAGGQQTATGKLVIAR